MMTNKSIYKKYIDLEMTAVDNNLLKKFNNSGLIEEQTLPIYKHTWIKKPGYFLNEVGYCSFEYGTAYMANHMIMHNVTIDMIVWWFTWHGLDSERYRLWNKKEHFDLQINSEDRKKLCDPTIPLRERIYGVTHVVNEDVGMGSGDISISFEDPTEMGFTQNDISNPEE